MVWDYSPPGQENDSNRNLGGVSHYILSQEAEHEGLNGTVYVTHKTHS